MKDKLKLELNLTGEAAFFIQMVMIQTGMSSQELFSKMIGLYKEVYFNDNELAWIEGDVIQQKLNSAELKRKST